MHTSPNIRIQYLVVSFTVITLPQSRVSFKFSYRIFFTFLLKKLTNWSSRRKTLGKKEREEENLTLAYFSSSSFLFLRKRKHERERGGVSLPSSLSYLSRLSLSLGAEGGWKGNNISPFFSRECENEERGEEKPKRKVKRTRKTKGTIRRKSERESSILFGLFSLSVEEKKENIYFLSIGEEGMENILSRASQLQRCELPPW